ncbi:sugar transferase [Pseudomonas sp. NFACC42-2]|uniref:sugar transferase n=1 Tax=Pseudomonas sp. NFACC42-2 TaxID=1566193 RepID=UPI00273A6727|nr:sugar transferase [Pseudomonas sp. NFACC42-2]
MKRIFDIVFSFLGLIVFFPALVILSVMIRLKLGSPIFFTQERPGLGGKPFKMIKFRTMRDAVDSDGIPLPDGERMTAFGSMLRSSSLDELPELWNVLKGEMSLVGPRPLLMQYLPLYSVEQNRRHEVRPGVTGWAQINGRNSVSWDEKFKLDTWYVDNKSMLLDIKIIISTVKKVLVRDGISQENNATMAPFMGEKVADQAICNDRRE